MKVFNANIVIYILFVSFILFPSLLVAQTNSKTGNRTDYNKSKFKSEFEKEFDIDSLYTLEEAPSNIDQVFFKTELPEWVFNIPESNSSIVYAIGVSDLGMSKDSARQLAILRAKAICALFTKSKMNGLVDYYVSEKDLKRGNAISSVYMEFNKIVSSVTFNEDDFTILKETFSVNNEAIILASLRLGKEISDDNAITINCLAEVSSSRMKKNNKYSTTSRMELMTVEKDSVENLYNHFYYIVKNRNKQIRILSNFLGNQLPENTALMTYKESDVYENSKEKLELSCTLQHGLWHALSTVLLQTLVLDFQESDVKQTSMGDQYVEVTQNLNRLLTQKEVSFRIKSLHIQNNTLQIETDFITQY